MVLGWTRAQVLLAPQPRSLHSGCSSVIQHSFLRFGPGQVAGVENADRSLEGANVRLEDLIVLVQVASTLCMVGIIWFVQIVHYPLFALVGPDRFTQYERSHCGRITWVVGPLMLAELVTAVLLPWFLPANAEVRLAWLGIAVLGAIWIVTYAIQVPQHARLSNAYDEQLQRRLVLGNWFRTFGWTLRGLVALVLLAQLIQ